MNYIIKTVDIIRSHDFLGGGGLIEIAKGKYQLATNLKIGLRKIKRKYYAND